MDIENSLIESRKSMQKCPLLSDFILEMVKNRMAEMERDALSPKKKKIMGFAFSGVAVSVIALSVALPLLLRKTGSMAGEIITVGNGQVQESWAWRMRMSANAGPLSTQTVKVEWFSPLLPKDETQKRMLDSLDIYDRDQKMTMTLTRHVPAPNYGDPDLSSITVFTADGTLEYFMEEYPGSEWWRSFEDSFTSNDLPIKNGTLFYKMLLKPADGGTIGLDNAKYVSENPDYHDGRIENRESFFSQVNIDYSISNSLITLSASSHSS